MERKISLNHPKTGNTIEEKDNSNVVPGGNEKLGGIKIDKVCNQMLEYVNQKSRVIVCQVYGKTPTHNTIYLFLTGVHWHN